MIQSDRRWWREKEREGGDKRQRLRERKKERDGESESERERHEQESLFKHQVCIARVPVCPSKPQTLAADTCCVFVHLGRTGSEPWMFSSSELPHGMNGYFMPRHSTKPLMKD